MEKKTLRPAPSAHAADHQGKVKRGNDGESYRSVPDKNGVYRWRKVAPSAPAAGAAKSKTAARGQTAKSKTAAKARGPAARATQKKSLDAAAERQHAEEALRKKIARGGLKTIERQIMAVARPSLVGAYRAADEDSLPLGASRLGGRPDVAEGFVWPMTTAVKKRAAGKKPAGKKPQAEPPPLSFLAQIDCADLAPHAALGDWPTSGLLSFFFETSSFRVGEESLVLYTPAGTPLTRAAAPDNLEGEHRYQAARVHTFSQHLTLPCRSDMALETLIPAAMQDETLDAYENVQVDTIPPGALQVGGYPDYVQYGTTGPDDRLLLQLAAPADLWDASVFGDTGIVYFWIRAADLGALRLGKSWAYRQDC
jgi:hypothetical protein